MEATPRLKAGIFARALVRRAEVAGAYAVIERKGSEEAGAIILTIATLDGWYIVLSQARDGQGRLVWIQPLGERVEEGKVDDWCEKQAKIDPDLWVVDIADRQGRTFVDEPIV